MVGDSIKTSGYSGVFPAGILIGTVDKVEIREEAPFYELRIKLAEDFQRLSFVTVIKSNLLHELDSLEQHGAAVSGDLDNDGDQDFFAGAFIGSSSGVRFSDVCVYKRLS